MDNKELERRKENDKKLFDYCIKEGIPLREPINQDKSYRIDLKDLNKRQFDEIGKLLKGN